MTAPHGFLTTGKAGERVPVNHRDALDGYAGCNKRLSLVSEAYLSHFAFPDGWLTYRQGTGSTRAYSGPCATDWIMADIDRPGDLAAALADARRITMCSMHKFNTLDDDAMLVYFSGSKGFHVGFPAATAGVVASEGFAGIARRFWEALAANAGVVIDTSIYTPQSLFRTPNTRHPATGLYKIRLSHRELTGLSAARVRDLATRPRPFDVPDVDAMRPDPAALSLWADATATTPTTLHVATRNVRPALQRATLDIVNGVRLPDPGERERRLFRAAADLTDHGVPAATVVELLNAPGRGCGLSPKELSHAVAGGIRHATGKGG